MKENPISFNAKMVNALLSGHKTQTRRPVKNDNEVCRYGEIGDRLWVRERINGGFGCDAEYEADQEDVFKNQNVLKRKSEWEELPCQMIDPQDMPRWASRITLEITGVRKQLIHQISEMDCIKEGFRGPDPLSDFSYYWHSIYGNVLPFQWDGQTVWVIDFKRVD